MTLDELSQKLISPPMPKLSGNVYCIGRNYAEHVKELKNEIPKEPVIFLKAPSALRTLNGSDLACATEEFHHEIELVLLCKDFCAMGTTADESLIGGITLGLDLTRRGLQNELKAKGLPWTLSKSFAGSGLLHSFVPYRNIGPIDFQLFVNEELRQSGTSSDMMFDFKAILNFILKYQHIHPGDIIYTGTPSGVAGFRKGERFRLESKALRIEADGQL